MERKDEIEILRKIMLSNSYFNKDLFLEKAKNDINRLYIYACKGNLDCKECNCYKEVQDKLLKNPLKYKIGKDVDVISIQYIGLHDYIENTEKYIQVYVSIYFYDKVYNNEIQRYNKDKYYNDIWIVTHKKDEDKNALKCDNCGATMQKYEENDLLECAYCKAKKHFNFKVGNWKIQDIEVM